MNLLTAPSLNTKYYSFPEYMELVEELVEQQTTTGNEKTAARIEFTKLNLQRMNRINKTLVLNEEMVKTMKHIKKGMNWILIGEAWCGDGAQLIPIIAKAAAINPLVDLQIILRDDNPSLMDEYLTNGARAIPKLIIRDAETGEDLKVWGARPEAISKKVQEYKSENVPFIKEEFEKHLHLWYARDKGQSMQEDLIQLLKNI